MYGRLAGIRKIAASEGRCDTERVTRYADFFEVSR
jgi:hypothetical protein